MRSVVSHKIPGNIPEFVDSTSANKLEEKMFPTGRVKEISQVGLQIYDITETETQFKTLSAGSRYPFVIIYTTAVKLRTQSWFVDNVFMFLYYIVNVDKACKMIGEVVSIM